MCAFKVRLSWPHAKRFEIVGTLQHMQLREVKDGECLTRLCGATEAWVVATRRCGWTVRWVVARLTCIVLDPI
jgi:hypothetical protein